MLIRSNSMKNKAVSHSLGDPHGSNGCADTTPPHSTAFVAPDQHRSPIALAVGLSTLLVGAIYATLAVYLASFHSFWSPDSGVRFAMLQRFLHRGSLALAQGSPTSLDMIAHLHPLSQWLVQTPKGLFAFYPPLFPFLSAPIYRAFGFAGLALLPLLAGLGAVLATTATAHRLDLRCHPVLPLILGLATPLALYSVVFWDPAIQIFLVALTGYFLWGALQHNVRWPAIAAGATLGVGLWFQETFFALFLALLLASLPLARKLNVRWLLGGLILGFGSVLLLWLGANWLLYGLPLGPHVLGNNNMADPTNYRQILSPTRFLWRSLLQLVGDPAQDPLALKLALLLLAVVLVNRVGGTLRRWLPILYLAVSGMAVALLLGTQWAHGLFEATPLLVPALVPPKPVPDAAPSTALFPGWIYRACLLFGAAILLNPIDPGMDWGSRYLIPLLSWLLLLALSSLEQDHKAAAGRSRWAWVMGGLSLLVASLFGQYQGVLAVRSDLIASRALIETAHSVPSPVLATDCFWLGPELEADPPSAIPFLVRSPSDQRAFFRAVSRLRASEFSFYGTPAGAAALAQAGLRLRPSFIRVVKEPKGILQLAIFKEAMR